jgi:hypothetical protein
VITHKVLEHVEIQMTVVVDFVAGKHPRAVEVNKDDQPAARASVKRANWGFEGRCFMGL